MRQVQILDIIFKGLFENIEAENGDQVIIQKDLLCVLKNSKSGRCVFVVAFSDLDQFFDDAIRLACLPDLDLCNCCKTA